MEMRVINISVHPDYFDDGSKSKFLKGTDVAFAVVEIPYDKYREMEDDEKERFQSSINLPPPSYYDFTDL